MISRERTGEMEAMKTCGAQKDNGNDTSHSQ